jgi:hypothetical protein
MMKRNGGLGFPQEANLDQRTPLFPSWIRRCHLGEPQYEL